MAFWSLSPYDLRALLSLQRGRSVLCLGEAHDPFTIYIYIQECKYILVNCWET